MYKYYPNNKHYVVVINDRNYLIDTGRPKSFSLSEHSGKITIDGNDYNMDPVPSDIRGIESVIEEMVGVKLDGFICNDIILKTSLTIYKNGFLDFKADKVTGRRCKFNMKNSFSMLIQDDNQRSLLIDTGAMIGYGKKELFNGLRPYARIKDFNPALGNLESDAYRIGIKVQGKRTITTVCDNDKVMFCLNGMNLGAYMVINVTDLFDEVCVIDSSTKEIIFN